MRIKNGEKKILKTAQEDEGSSEMLIKYGEMKP